VRATTFLLDDPASSISVLFDSNGGRFMVTNKADGFVWQNPTNGGGSMMQISNRSQPWSTEVGKIN
jgi:hypothetical protein